MHIILTATIIFILMTSGCAITEVRKEHERLKAKTYVTAKEYYSVSRLNESQMYDFNLLSQPFVKGFGEYHIPSIFLNKSYQNIMELIGTKSFFNKEPINGFKGTDLRKVIYVKNKAIVAFTALDRGQHLSGMYLLSLEGRELKIKYLGRYDENAYLFFDGDR